MNPELQQPTQLPAASPAPQPTFQQPAYQQPHSPVAQKSTNTLAIAGFICSFFFQILGLVLSIIGLNQIKKTGEGGHGLAVAGIVISSISIVFQIIFGFIWLIAIIGAASESAALRVFLG